MSGSARTPEGMPPGVRHYSFLCLAAVGLLFVVLMLLLRDWAQVYGLLPVVVGLVGVGLRWRLAPLVMVLTLGGLLMVTGELGQLPIGGPPLPPSVADLALCAAVLAYVAGHYRLQGLTQFLFPRDPRRPARAAPVRGRPSSALPPQRSPGLASSEELIQFLLAVPVCLLLAVLAYRSLVASAPTPDIFEQDWRKTPGGPGESALATVQFLTDALWRGRYLLWTLGAGTLVMSGLLSYVAWQRRSRAEAVLFLQDVVWADTRGEQRRIDAWRVGARRRRERKKESS